MCLICYCLEDIYKCFVYDNALYASIRSKWAKYICIRFFQLAKKIFILVYSQYDYTYCVRQWFWRLEWICNFIPMIMWKYGVKNNGVMDGVTDCDSTEYSNLALANTVNGENGNEWVLVTIYRNSNKIQTT